MFSRGRPLRQRFVKILGFGAVVASGAAAYHQYQWFVFRNTGGSYDTPIGGPNTKTSWLEDGALAAMAGKALDTLGGYAATAYNRGGIREPHTLRPPLDSHSLHDGHRSYDVCIVGGGFAGLHTALSLAERGKTVVVLEAKRIGHAASGRNGGDAVIGFHTEVEELAEFVGDEKCRALYSQSATGYRRLKHIIAKYKIQCDAKEEGCLTMSFAGRLKLSPGHSARLTNNSSSSSVANTSPELEAELKEARAYCEKMKTKYGEEAFVYTLDDIKAKLGLLVSDRYSYGIFNPRNLTLNPLELVLGLARACTETQKVTIHEMSPVAKLQRVKSDSVACGEKWLVSTDIGSVRADEVVIATNGAPAHLSPRLAVATTPLSTGMMLTKPLPQDILDRCLTAKCAVFDERFALAYFRRVPGNRILFGSLASGLPIEPEMLKARLTQDLALTFPALASYIDATVAWQGMLEARFPIFPVVGRDETNNGLWYSIGFSGHGLVPTCAAGEVVAAGIASIDHKHDKLRVPQDRRHELWSEVGYLTNAKKTPMPPGSLVESSTATSLPPVPSAAASAASALPPSGPQRWKLSPVFPPAGGPWGMLGCSVFCSLVEYWDKWEKKW